MSVFVDTNTMHQLCTVPDARKTHVGFRGGSHLARGAGLPIGLMQNRCIYLSCLNLYYFSDSPYYPL